MACCSKFTSCVVSIGSTPVRESLSFFCKYVLIAALALIKSIMKKKEI